MRLIKPYFKILEQFPGLAGVYKQIELAGRTCYKSEDKITEDSAKEFVDRMIKSGHGAMLEHGTVYLDFTDDWQRGRDRYIYNKYSKVYKNTLENGWLAPHLYVTTNFRVLVENNWLDDLQYLCEPTEYHERKYTVKFICDRGVSHEFVRHRVFSFAQESTRYCNYSKDKFGNELTFIQPCWITETEFDKCDTDEKIFIQGLKNSEDLYLHLLSIGWKAQEARAILPNSLKTELVMTGFVSDWKHFFFLRDAVSAHPQARELAEPLHSTFIQREYIKD